MTKITIKIPGPVINEGYVVVKGSLCGGIDGANFTHLNNETMQSRVRWNFVMCQPWAVPEILPSVCLLQSPAYCLLRKSSVLLCNPLLLHLPHWVIHFQICLLLSSTSHLTMPAPSSPILWASSPSSWLSGFSSRPFLIPASTSLMFSSSSSFKSSFTGSKSSSTFFWVASPRTSNSSLKWSLDTYRNVKIRVRHQTG